MRGVMCSNNRLSARRTGDTEGSVQIVQKKNRLGDIILRLVPTSLYVFQQIFDRF